ncbi:DUF2087 domain-containing protein [Bacillus luteolus]|uniref:DUF2087 domain-containing protein n=1 Tax=Litchfieldia luteola TaxID=682179 RepID=A0ABR9QN44_9BACI|nr:DUF2087 domain-containing protein [Cytobacillus luteolus]MBE4909917.1 DUF2087 domain-containing protein [Cytobacillus luteolus]MBP1942528.1 hypothetical protein [Cytobacillus luteolus]
MLNEEEKIITTYFKNNERLSLLPKKEKKKLIILKYIREKYFQEDLEYTEKDINQILKSVYGDFVTLRRDLIDYKFLNRNDDGSSYWL